MGPISDWRQITVFVFRKRSIAHQRSTCGNGGSSKPTCKGVSIRSVDELVKAMDGAGVSESQVGRRFEEIDGRVNALPCARSKALWSGSTAM